MSEFKSDIDLMVANAKKYNVKDSQVYEDAIKIQVYTIIKVSITHTLNSLYSLEICKILDST